MLIGITEWFEAYAKINPFLTEEEIGEKYADYIESSPIPDCSEFDYLDDFRLFLPFPINLIGYKIIEAQDAGRNDNLT